MGLGRHEETKVGRRKTYSGMQPPGQASSLRAGLMVLAADNHVSEMEQQLAKDISDRQKTRLFSDDK